MKVTIHQPEHFPYMGFFQKIQSSDVFIILDNVKFRKNYFQNRNKVLLKSGKDEWITVQVGKEASSQKINEVKAKWNNMHKRKLLQKIYQNFDFDASEIYSHEKLIDINMASINWAFDILKIKTSVVFASDLNVPGSKSELLSNLIREVGGTTYVSGPSGKDYLDLSYFNEIDVEFFQPQVNNYYSCLYNLLNNKENL